MRLGGRAHVMDMRLRHWVGLHAWRHLHPIPDEISPVDRGGWSHCDWCGADKAATRCDCGRTHG